jgi:phage terminase small subunit
MLGDDLTFKQFLFAEAYLRHYNVEKACREAYPNMNSKNGSNVLKSRKVIAYLKNRLEEKKATIERLTDKMHKVLGEALESPDPEVALEATKQVARLKEINNKINELDAIKEQKPSQITFSVVQKET